MNIFPIYQGGGQEKIPDTYDGVGGCPEHGILGFFPTYFGIFSEKIYYFLSNFNHFFAFLYQILHFFAKREPN